MKPQTKFKQTEIGMIPEDWEVKSIGELDIKVIDGDRGTNYPKQEDLLPRGFCLFLNTGNIQNDQFIFNDCSFITKERDELLRKGKLKRGDLVLTTRGTVGNVAFYNETVKFDDIRINSGMVVIRNEKNVFDNYFLYLLLRSPFVKKQFVSFSTGSAQPQLPIRDLNKINLIIPPLHEQSAIAHVLSDLDSKIELNQQMNKTLETIGQVIFKYWFVDFEFPNEKGMPYKSSGGEMVDSELGEVPRGWRVGSLGDICEITMGQSPPGETYNETGDGVPFYQGIKDFGFRFPNRRVYCTAPTRFAEEGDVLLSVRAPVGSLNVAEERCAIGRGVAALRLKEEQNGYLYYLLRATQSGWSKFEAEGTVFGSVSKSDVHEFKVLLPSNALLNQFGSLVEPLDKQIATNEKESRTLAAIRDALLPKLMVGEITVRVEGDNG